MMSSDTLSNVHCLGCKTRHETVNVSVVNVLSVKGSPRYQAKGTCENGKTWTKILNKKEREQLAHMIAKETTEEAPEVSEAEIVSEITEKNSETKNKVTENETEDIMALFADTENEVEIESDNIVFEQPVEVLKETTESEKTVAPQTKTPMSGDLSTLDISPLQGAKEVFAEANQRRAVELEAVSLRSEIQNLNEPSADVRRVRRIENRRTENENLSLEAVKVREQKGHRRIAHISGEQAFKVGRHYGYNEATFSGERYREGLSFHFERSRVSPQFFDAFTQGYIEGGERFLISAQHGPQMNEMPTPSDSAISPRTTAGLAAASIFGAWVASKIRRG